MIAEPRQTDWLTGSPGSLRQLIQAMVKVLAGSPHLSSPSGARILVRTLSRAFGQPVGLPDAQVRADDHLHELVTQCVNLPEGPDALSDAVAMLTGDSWSSRELRLLSDQFFAATLLSSQDLHVLRRLITSTAFDDAAGIAQASLQPLPAPLPVHCTGAWSILLHLLRRNALPSGLPPFVAYLEYLAAAAQQAHVADEIRSWNLQRAQDRGYEPALLTCRSTAVAPRAGSQSEPRTMFVLLPDGLQSDYYILRVWHDDGSASNAPTLRDDDTRVRGSDIARAVYNRLNSAFSGDTAPQPRLAVEFWLPLSLVNEPVWDWCQPISEADRAWDCHVVVRSLERLQSPDWHSLWRRRWADLMGEDTEGEVSEAEEADASADDEAAPVPLVLNFPPDVKEGRIELMNALRSGVPAILWHRDNCALPSFRRSLQDLIQDGPLKDLPSRIGKIQLAHGNDADLDALRGVTLLWDDPNRPLPALNRLVAPGEVITH